MAENKGVIIEENPEKPQNPKISRAKRVARKVILGGLGLAATATGIGLSLDAHQRSTKTDAPPDKPTPALISPLPPDLSPSPSPRVVTSAQMEEEALKQIPHLDLADFLKLSKDEQEKIISNIEGKTALLILDNASTLKLNYSSDDEYNNKVLVDFNTNKELPVQFVLSPSGYEDLKKKSIDKNFDITFPEGTSLLTLVLFDQHSEEPGIRLSPLQLVSPVKPQHPNPHPNKIT